MVVPRPFGIEGDARWLTPSRRRGGLRGTLPGVQKLQLSGSRRLFERAAEFVPGGVAGIRHPDNFIPGEYPIFLERGRGGRVFDVDGNEYVDLLAAYGPVFIGHAEPEIDAAVRDQLERGFCFTLPQRWQNELMERLVRLVPSAERGLPLKTGSDATSAAVRIARAATGRTKVLRCGYHGWHDWCVEGAAGVPASHREHTLAFAYNDLDQAAELLRRHQGDVAALIVTPVGHEFDRQLEEPDPEFLPGLRALADEQGAILVFDEVRTGFRVANGGAQERYGVTPDLTALGKGMANGYSIAALVGRSEVMDAAGKAFISSTYFPNSLEMVAACATLDLIVRDHVVDAVARKAEGLQRNLLELIERHGVPATLSPFPQMPFVHFDPSLSPQHDRWREDFCRHAIRAGLFVHPKHHGFVMFRHTEEDLARVAQVVEDAFAACKRSLSR